MGCPLEPGRELSIPSVYCALQLLCPSDLRLKLCIVKHAIGNNLYKLRPDWIDAVHR